MATSSSRIVLHQAKTTFLWWVVPLFVVLGCVLVSVNLWLPVMSRPAGEAGAGLWLSVGVAVLASLAIPVAAGLIFFFVPTITTLLDPQRRVVVMELRRPLGRSVKEFPLAEVADVAPLRVGNRRYVLTLRLKSGENVRLDYRLLPEAAQVQALVEGIKGKLADIR